MYDAKSTTDLIKDFIALLTCTNFVNAIFPVTYAIWARCFWYSSGLFLRVLNFGKYSEKSLLSSAISPKNNGDFIADCLSLGRKHLTQEENENKVKYIPGSKKISVK